MKLQAYTHFSAAPVEHSAMANAIRALAMDAVERVRSGHPGMPMGMADVATVQWPGRDGSFIGMNGFGSSAPAEDLYRHFDITAASMAAAGRSLLEMRSWPGHMVAASRSAAEVAPVSELAGRYRGLLDPHIGPARDAAE